jgi:ribosomal protein S13
MARLAGVDLPRRKAIAYALPYVYGSRGAPCLRTAQPSEERGRVPADSTRLRDLSARGSTPLVVLVVLELAAAF